MTQFVLAAIDLTHRTEEAVVLKKARAMAKLENMPLAVVTVLPDYRSNVVSTYFSEDFANNMAEESREALHKYVSDTIGHDDEIKHIVRIGSVYDEVLKTADELEVGLIVMGAHKPDLADYLLGANAARVARHARCSVYIVRS